MKKPEPLTSVAVVATRNGGPEVLLVRPWRVRSPRQHEVRIRVEATGISFADLLMCQDRHPDRWFPRRRRTPLVPGWDIVGIVESVGSEVRDVRVGQRVAALSIVGAWAEYAVVPAAWVVPVPPKIESATAVCLVLDYITAYQMLTRSASVKRGDTILIQGAGGGVGTALLQLARHLGVRALATDRERKRAHIESAGGILIDFEHEDVVQRARALTEGRGVDCAFDGIGDTASASLRALRPGGRLVWYGFGVLRARLIGVLALGLLGSLCPGGKRTSIYSIQWLARRHPDWYREDLSTLLELVAEHEIAPSIAAVLKLEEIPSALTRLAGHGPPGKQVVAIAPSGLTSAVSDKASTGSVALRV